jgi:hypothetical protein
MFEMMGMSETVARNRFKALMGIVLRMYGEIAANDDAPPAMRLDALKHIAMMSGAIDGFTDSKGVKRSRDDWDKVESLAMLYRAEKELGQVFITDKFPSHKEMCGYLWECRRNAGYEPPPLRLNTFKPGSVGKGARGGRRGR